MHIYLHQENFYKTKITIKFMKKMREYEELKITFKTNKYFMKKIFEIYDLKKLSKLRKIIKLYYVMEHSTYYILDTSSIFLRQNNLVIS